LQGDKVIGIGAFRLLERSVAYGTTLGWFASACAIVEVGVARMIGTKYVHFCEPTTRRRLRLRAKSSDVAVFEQIFVRREYDMENIAQARDLALKEAASESRLTIIDCGANIGCSVVWFATQFPGAHIVAIEPEAENFKLLLHNIRELPNVRAIRAAIWSKKTEVVISNPNTSEWAYQTSALESAPPLNDETQAQPIPTVTIDELLQPGFDGRCIVKIDIEGAESALFTEYHDWLDKVDVLSIELHDYLFPWRGTSRSFISAMSARPIDYVWHGENLFCFKDPGDLYHTMT
jgi:FkbM family methyltransferase